MWHYFPRGPLENRVLKTRFIIQKNFKNLQVSHLTGSDQNKERLRSERGRPDKRERNSQIREGEKEIAWAAHLGRANPGRATQVHGLGRANPSRAPGFALGWCCLGIYWVRNRVLETRFPCRRHLEKVTRRRGITHENRALKARFRTLKSSL